MVTFSHRIAAVLAAACVGAAGGLPVAAADDPDERFEAAVAALGIPTSAGSDVAAVGHQICDMLTANLAGAVNPVPAVRGVVSTLQNKGLSRSQAGGLLRAAVVIYCPQQGPTIGL